MNDEDFPPLDIGIAWKPEVFVQGKWSQNALVFPTEAEALASARDLMGRWILVEDCRAIAVTDLEPNYRWKAWGLEAIK